MLYSDVQGGEAAAYIEDGYTLNWGDGNIDADPLFVLGPGGCYYLSQTAAGQAEQSPCVDAGSDTAANLGLDILTTRTDEVTDAGVVDMGYHYLVLGTGIVDRDLDLEDLDIFVPVLLGTDLDLCRKAMIRLVVGRIHEPRTGADGNRTHQALQSSASTALKTAEPTRNPDAPQIKPLDRQRALAIVIRPRETGNRAAGSARPSGGARCTRA